MTSAEKFSRLSGGSAGHSNLKHRSVRGALFTAVGGGLEFCLKLGATLILARLLIPEYFGLVAMVTVVTNIAETFSKLGLSTATIQARAITQRQCSNLFWINVTAGAVFSLGVCALAPFIADFYREPRLVAIAVIISTNFIWIGLTVQHEALLIRQMKLPQIAGNRLAASLISICLAVALAANGHLYWALVWREVSRMFLTAVGAWILCPWIPGRPRRGTDSAGLLRFGRDMTITDMLVAITGQLDSLLIGRFAGPVALGLYRQAYNLMMAPISQLSTPINSVSQPSLSMLRDDPPRYRRYYQRILLIVSLATLPIGIFAAIYADEIVIVLLGPTWIGAAPFLRIFGVAAAIRPTVATSAMVLITCGQSGRFLTTAIVHSGTLLVLMSIGVAWGAIGIAIAHVSTTFLLLPWKLRYSYANTPVTVSDFCRAVSTPLAASLAMTVTLVLLRALAPLDDGITSLLAGGIAALAVYFTTFVILPGGWRQLRDLIAEVLAALRSKGG